MRGEIIWRDNGSEFCRIKESYKSSEWESPKIPTETNQETSRPNAS